MHLKFRANPKRALVKLLIKLYMWVVYKGDGYKTTGCYNINCPGFVQINRRIALGSAFNHISSYNGNQYSVGISIYKVILCTCLFSVEIFVVNSFLRWFVNYLYTHTHIYIRKKYKKPPKLTIVCDRVLQCLKCIKVAYQTIKVCQKSHIILYIIIIPIFF